MERKDQSGGRNYMLDTRKRLAVDKEGRCVISLASCILRCTSIVSRMTGSHRVDGEQRDARIEPEGSDAHLGGQFSAVKHPTERHWQIAVDNHTLDRDWLAGG